MQLLGVEVGGETGRLSGGEYASSLLDVEDASFTEHVDAVHAQLTAVHSTYDVRQLDIDDVGSRLLRRRTSAQQCWPFTDGFSLSLSISSVFCCRAGSGYPNGHSVLGNSRGGFLLPSSRFMISEIVIRVFLLLGTVCPRHPPGATLL